MPKMVVEITQGVTFEFSSDQGGAAASTPRVFRIIKDTPDEDIILPEVCDVRIGDEHPRESGLYCVSYNGAYDGQSRMVILATFVYRTTPSADASGGGGGGGGRDPKSYEPEVRPANWYCSTSLMEAPVYSWQRVNNVAGDNLEANKPPENPAGDIYDNASRLIPVVSIFIEQFEKTDPTRHVLHAGKTNSNVWLVGSLAIPRRCAMFRGVQSKPVAEQWGDELRRGWSCTYEFLFKKNSAYAYVGGAYVIQDVGWDVLQPLSGFNVKAFVPNLVQNTNDNFGQPLKLDSDFKIAQPLALPDGIGAGDKVRGMVRISGADNATTQLPCAQPIPLNEDGTPRIESANPKVLVHRYKVTEEIDFDTTFDLRLD
jgi:hypothetical protein